MKYLKQIVLSLLRSIGYSLHKINSPTKITASTMTLALERMKMVGVLPTSIIDVGSAKGHWTLLAKSHFPEAKYILVEPLQEQIEMMPGNTISNNDRVVNAVLGNKEQTVSFTVTEDLDGSGLYGGAGSVRQVQMIKLEDLITTGNVLIKLDTHGYELEIFEGIGTKWDNVSAFVVEVYGFYVSPTGRLFHEVSSVLEKKGYRLFDIVDICRRKADQAFWQADAIYLKADHSLFANNSYQ